jgi:hypothetical protein
VVEGVLVVGAGLGFTIVALGYAPAALPIAAVLGICYGSVPGTPFFLEGITRRRQDTIFTCLRWLAATLPVVMSFGITMVTGPLATTRVGSYFLAVGFTYRRVNFPTFIIAVLTMGISGVGWETTKRLLEQARNSLKTRLDQAQKIGEATWQSRWTNLRKDVIETLQAMIFLAVFLLALGIVISVLVMAGSLIWRVMPLPIKTLLTSISYLNLFMAIAVVFSFLPLSKAIAFYSAVLVNLMLDRKRMSQLGIPSEISCDEIFQNLTSFRSPKGRREYLVLLRLRRVKLNGPVCGQPKFLMSSTGSSDTQLAEEFARLREQWSGLRN